MSRKNQSRVLVLVLEELSSSGSGHSPTVATVAVAVDSRDLPQLPQYPQPASDTVESLEVCGFRERRFEKTKIDKMKN